MFARFKNVHGKEFNIVPYKVLSLAETDRGTEIVLDGSLTYETNDSIRKVRSTLTKAANNQAAADTPEAPEEA